MSLNNFENNIKESLEKRRISPSKDSWNTLANKLEQKKAFPFKTVLVAASLLGVIVTLMLTFKNNTSTITKVSPLKKDTIFSKKPKTQNQLTKLKVDLDSTNSTMNNTIEQSTQQRLTKQFKNSSLAKNEPKEIMDDDFNTSYTENTRLNIQNHIVKVDKKMDSTSILYKDEFELLLANAKNTILLEKKSKKSRLTNYNSLLEEAEIELEIDNSLKNKIYKTVVSNYQLLSKSNKKQN